MDETETVGATPLLGDAGPCPTVTHDKKTWTVGHPTQRAKAELEKLVVEVAQKSLDDLRGVLPPAKIAEKEAALDGLLFARAWQTWGSLWSQVVNGPLAFPLLLASLLRQRHPEATLADAEALWAGANRPCRTALMMVVPGFFTVLAGSLPADAADRQALAERTAAALVASLARPTLTA
jgi:hypothetical protein